MKSIVIIPAYNEKDNIIKTIEDIKLHHDGLDIIVINDGSSDETKKVLEQNKIDYIDLPINLGIGGAVQTGFKYAFENDYDIAIQFDGDGQHKASEINKLVKKLKKETDVVIGSRFLTKEENFRSTFMRRKGIWIFKIVNYLLIRQVITDNTSGFRAYNKRAIEFLSKHYPCDYPEPEAVVLLGKNGFRIMEISVEMQERGFGRSSIRNWRIPYYMFKVLLAIFMVAVRRRENNC
ncbi:MAG: glycosyltransferase family 2 protein [Candidatus Delongbacteria bacterium]|nr:glycosyltransferase family 2 protein [Candidatus Delongbacteria bacterium]